MNFFIVEIHGWQRFFDRDDNYITNRSGSAGEFSASGTATKNPDDQSGFGAGIISYVNYRFLLNHSNQPFYFITAVTYCPEGQISATALLRNTLFFRRLYNLDQSPAFGFAHAAALGDFDQVSDIGLIGLVMNMSNSTPFEHFSVLWVFSQIIKNHPDGFISGPGRYLSDTGTKRFSLGCIHYTNILHKN